jgi:hypothetical protein
MYVFNPEVLLTMTREQVDRHYFLIGEYRFGIIAVSLAAESQL